MTTLIQRLRIEEISGVDDPANELPGWMVTKARGRRLLDAADPASTFFLKSICKAILHAPRDIDAPSDETLRKSVEMFGPTLTLLIADGSVEVAKAAQRHPSTGRFMAPILPMANGGAVHPTLARLTAEHGRRHPVFSPASGDAPTSAIEEFRPDPSANPHPHSSAIE